MSKFIEYIKNCNSKHPILTNLVAVFLSFILLSLIAMFFLDIWTHHGSHTRVPEIVGMKIEDAIENLEQADLNYIISDSVYSKDKRPGTIADVVPQAGSLVKSGREVYLTIVAYSPKPVVIDVLLTDISWRQAKSYLESKGVHVETRFVDSQFPDLVVDARCNGKSLGVGSKVTVDDIVVLYVGREIIPDRSADGVLSHLIDAAIEMEGDSTSTSQTNDFDIEVTESEPFGTSATPEQHVKNQFGVN